MFCTRARAHLRALMTQNSCAVGMRNANLGNYLKVAEHSFQVPMPNSPLLLNHVCFGARFLQKSR